MGTGNMVFIKTHGHTIPSFECSIRQLLLARSSVSSVSEWVTKMPTKRLPSSERLTFGM